eukprot:362836-Chlamydomonas_euryale.AAC.3
MQQWQDVVEAVRSKGSQQRRQYTAEAAHSMQLQDHQKGPLEAATPRACLWVNVEPPFPWPALAMCVLRLSREGP